MLKQLTIKIITDESWTYNLSCDDIFTIPEFLNLFGQLLLFNFFFQ